MSAGPGDEYFRAYLLKNQAERLEKAGDIPGAVQKYHEASQIITKVAHDYPGWQSQVVSFRLKRIEEAILRLCAQSNLPVPSNDPKAASPAKPRTRQPAPKTRRPTNTFALISSRIRPGALEKAGDIPGAVQKYHEASQIITKVACDYPDRSIDPGVNAKRPPVDPNIVPK